MSKRSDPVRNGAAAILSDTVDLLSPGRGIIVGVSGDVKVTTVEGVDIVLPALAAGIMHPVEVARVWTTGTDALTAAGTITIVW